MRNILKSISIGIVLLMFPLAISSQTQSENYVMNKTYKVGLQENELGTQHKDSVSTSITYFDGLGRAKQQVLVKASGIVNNQNAVSYDWTDGNTGATDFFNQNGYSYESGIINGETPFGNTDLLWECRPDTSNNADGGWNTDYFEIDNTKSYRYTIWVKKTGSVANPTSGRTDHGIQNVNNLNGSFNANPYFLNLFLPEVDTWYLLVGMVHPKDYTGGDTDLSGLYDIDGNKIVDGTEFKWSSSHTTTRLRNFLNYCTNTSVRQHFWSPLFQKIDGTELSLNEVFTTSDVIIDGETANDIVTHIKYDDLGRVKKEFLPYVASSNDGKFQNGDISAITNSFYQNKFSEDFAGVALPDVNAYAEKDFEASPLNRVLKQAAPGKDWKMGSGHEVKLEYGSNSINEVRVFSVDLSTGIPALQGGTNYYPTGRLTKLITKSEDWKSSDGLNKTTEEFKNLQGQIVLKRMYANTDASSQEAHDTYYVYDDFGNLTYTLPPKSEAHIDLPNSNELNDLCYQYRYDSKRNRLVEKKVPGKGWEYLVYDKLDRPILSQDAVQRQNNKWLYTKYDKLGRVAYTGLYTHDVAVSQAEMQNYVNSVNNVASKLYESKQTSAGSNSIYYTNQNFPTNMEVLTVSYYDNYDFDKAGTTNSITTSYNIPSTDRLKGLSTGNKVKVLDTNQWITTVTYYDDKARPIYVYSKNDYLQTIDIVESMLDDFTGKVLETKTTHQKTGKSDIVTIDNFEYDHMDRLLVQNQKINNQLSKRLVKNNYDELGQLESKLVGSGTKQGYKDVSSGIRVTDDAITKIGGASWSVGLATQGSFDADGYVSFSPTQQNRYYMVGLSNMNLDAHYSSINHAIYLVHTSNVYVFESGVSKGRKTGYEIGDVFKVERIGTEIHYKKNGETFYISETPSSGSLIGDISMVHTGAKIKDFHIVDNSKGLQKVDYNYNVRGWLKNINQDAYDDNDLFNYTLRYNDATDPNKALFNGNISETSWNTLNQDTSVKTYSYIYDALNRIKSADFIGDSSSGRYDISGIEYDKNGNLLSLTRKGHTDFNATTFGVMDDLRYFYDAGNKLMAVEDKSLIAEGFKDGNTVEDDFVYDINGNLISDANKGISSITYNHLNLPVEVQVPSLDNAKVTYVYDATGIKLKKITTIQLAGGGENIQTKEYAGNYQYEDNTLAYFNHAEGYVKTNTTANGIEMSYVYSYTDQSGSIRLSYSDNNNDGEISQDEILEENSYYPFGLKMKGFNGVINGFVDHPYGYNGKEENFQLGIGWLDFGARNYDAAIGRWMNIDPLAEQMTRHSPYNYSFNNPIYYIDPDGMMPTGAFGESLENHSVSWSSSNSNDWEFNVSEKGGDWIDNGDGTWTAQKGDGAETLAQDAKISKEEAYILMHIQGHGTYVDREDGVTKSAIDPGETVNVSKIGTIELDPIFISTNSDMKLIYDNTWTKGFPQFLENGKPYRFDVKDLDVAIAVLSSKGNNVIKKEIRKRLRDGLNGSPTPLSKETYFQWYGHTLGNMKLVDSYIMMADMVTSYNNPKVLNTRGFNLKPTTSKPSIKVSGANRTIHTGPRGGKYYINSNGNKSYIKK